MKCLRLLSVVCGCMSGIAAMAAEDVPIPQPNTLRAKIEDPNTNIQQMGGDGRSVAVSGDFAVVGCPLDAFGGRNAGVVKVYHASTGVLLRTISLPYSAVGTFGQSVAISGTHLVVGAPSTSSGKGAVYVFDLASPTPETPIRYLRGDSEGGTEFGRAVAISGTRVATSQARSSYGGRGKIMIYDLASATPDVAIRSIRHPANPYEDNFGQSIALEANRLVVSAPSSSSAATTFVYDLAGATPEQPVQTLAPLTTYASSDQRVALSGSLLAVADQQKISLFDLDGIDPTVPVHKFESPNATAGDNFARAIALTGTRLVVGAYGDDSQAIDAGRAYIYDLASSDPSASALIVPNPNSVPMPSEYFGLAVAISGTRVLISATRAAPVGEGAGTTYVYEIAGTTPAAPFAVLRNTVLSRMDLFGNSVAISGQRMVVSSPGDNAQRVDVFDLAGPTPGTPALTLRNPYPFYYNGWMGYGISASISGNWVVVGNQTYQNRGAVHVYNLDSTTPTTPVRTLLPPPPYSRLFGQMVAISGSRVVVASPEKNPAGSGRVYVFDLAGANPNTPVAEFASPATSPSDNFGAAVAISGTRVLVGAPLGDFPNTGAGTDAGIVYLYDISSTTPTNPVSILHNPNPFSQDMFGSAVAMSGTRGIVGAPNDDGSIPYTDGVTVPRSGRAFVYDFAGTTPTVPILTIDNPLKSSLAIRGNFGGAVTISGTRVAVGAERNNLANRSFPSSELGAVYTFDLTAVRPGVPTATLSNANAARQDHFGNAVAIDGTTLVVGAAEEDGLTYDRGAVYLYDSDNAGPAGGSMVLNPLPLTPGKSLNIQFSHWNDATPPLKYALLLNDVVISADGAGASRAVFAPATAGQYILKGRVTDAFGNVTTTTFPFTVWPAIGNWRQTHFGSPVDAGIGADLADADGDGMNNYFEYIAGLAPKDPASRFVTRVETVVGQPRHRAIKFGPISAGCTYIVKTKTALTDPTWTPLHTFTTSDIGTERIVVDLAAGTWQQFYQVEIQAGPAAE